MKRLLILILILSWSGIAWAQKPAVVSRVILIGDAGEMDTQQSQVLKHAASQVIKGKTTVLFLGDNIYPRGMGLPGSAEEQKTKEILQSQYVPLRATGAPVYFLPGNHDWDKSGPQGLAKIKRQWEFLDEQKDSLLKMVPRDGCPDPVEINVSKDLTIIAFDSEWFLYTFNKSNPEPECDCATKDDVLRKIQDLYYKNRGKVILLASHHPFQSYGIHGGHFSFKDHLFPLTAFNDDLKIPLPFVGSIYPFLRSTFPNEEDLNHPDYKDMVQKINALFGTFPNMVHVAGHEHGLQFIKTNKQIQVISGAGAKHSYVVKGKNALYADATQGYVTADILTDKSMLFTYYKDTDSGVVQTFAYNKPYVVVKEKLDSLHKPIIGDSITLAVHPAYDQVSGVHRFLFGENYRKEWAAPTKLPVIRLSTLHGGLVPIQMGGGFQTNSLRLVDKSGKEWVLRGVEKAPEKILPEELQETFAKDLVDDALSAQHPFSALVVPPLAVAARVPHANPIIGVVSADVNLGKYAPLFVNKIALLEEREPIGESENTPKTVKKLDKDNDNNIDAEAFLRARLLDLLIGDWDRHGDQWRWKKEKGDGEDVYTGVPRDRDQAMYVNQGLIPTQVSKPGIVPNLQGWGGKIKDIRYSLWKTVFMDRYPAAHFSYEQYMKIVNDFVAAETDEVLEAGLRRLPASAYTLRHDQLMASLKERRKNIPEEMSWYYKYSNKIVDVHASGKNELITVKDTVNNGLKVTVNKVNKDGKVQKALMNTAYYPDVTKEIRIYTGGGSDQVILDNKTSNIKLRIVDSTGTKNIEVRNAKRKVQLYDIGNKLKLKGDSSRLKIHLSGDSVNTSFLPVNLIHEFIPIYTGQFNPDEGVLIGAGFKYIRQEGFRKLPYNYMHEFLVYHSFTTKAFRIRYRGEFIQAVGNADLTIQARADAPDNSINFFGRGNETELNKFDGYQKYYRARFNIFQFDPALRWHTETGTSVSIGPSFQYYHYDVENNEGRLTQNPELIGSYDANTIDKDKMHAGIIVNFLNDKRNNKVLPAWGSYVNIKVQGYAGLNGYSKSFAQIIPEVALYKALNTRATVILAERFGGGVTIGKTAFYQSLFLGSQGNLMGFRQFRFAGQHSFYNNLELRMKLGDFANYLVPGQVGLIGFYDTGRVWEKEDNSSKWHHGTGAGIYLAPAELTVIKFIMGRSTEGWYPYLSLGMRF